jgi:hypothetical protein
MNALERQKADPVPSPGRLNQAIEWLRTRPAYRTFFHVLSSELVPLFFGLVVIYGAIAVLSQSLFSIRSSLGYVCAGSAELKAVESTLQPIRWQTSELCKGTGLKLQKGATYKLRFTIPSAQPWLDRTVPASPNGVEPNEVTWPMVLGVPFRRHMGQAWFKPMARINSRGTDVYPLDPKPTVPLSVAPHRVGDLTSQETVFETEIVARTQGELFLYVNDAVLFIPFYPDSVRWLYNNNQGTAEVRIEWIQALPSQAEGK